MKTRLTILLLSVAAFSGAAVLVTVAQNAARVPEWKEVDADVRKGLPKSAIQKIEPIIAMAMK